MSIFILWKIAERNVHGFVKKSVAEFMASTTEYKAKLKRAIPQKLASKAIGQIPVLGPVASPLFDWTTGKIIAKNDLKDLRSELSKKSEPHERLKLATKILELDTLSKIRLKHGQVRTFLGEEWKPEIVDCASATMAAESCAAASMCLGEFKDWLAIVRTFANDFEFEVAQAEERIAERKEYLNMIAGRFFDKHRENREICAGNKECYLILSSQHEGIELMPMRKADG